MFLSSNRAWHWPVLHLTKILRNHETAYKETPSSYGWERHSLYTQRKFRTWDEQPTVADWDCMDYAIQKY